MTNLRVIHRAGRGVRCHGGSMPSTLRQSDHPTTWLGPEVSTECRGRRCRLAGGERGLRPCLDVVGNSTAPGSGVNIYDCNGRPTRRGPSPRPVSCGSTTKRCAWTWSARTPPPRPTAQIYTCNGGANQKLAAQRRRHHRRRPVRPVPGRDRRGHGEQHPVGLWTCNGQSNQQWTTRARQRRHQPPTVPGNAAGERPDLRLGDVRVERLDRQRGRRVLRHLPRRPADEVGQRHARCPPA